MDVPSSAAGVVEVLVGLGDKVGEGAVIKVEADRRRWPAQRRRRPAAQARRCRWLALPAAAAADRRRPRRCARRRGDAEYDMVVLGAGPAATRRPSAPPTSA